MDYTPETLRNWADTKSDTGYMPHVDALYLFAHADAWRAEQKQMQSLAHALRTKETRIEELETKLREVAAMFEGLDKKNAGLQVHLATIDEIIDAALAGEK